MPISGGTRMLRARRKDCNVKPNRRLDRKSSRGMLFENEELRMRTITINAEVEQGQHALKKLRRENEQLRREMWCLRDEYDKMEKLLRKKETDEDSNEENSDSDCNLSPSYESDEEKVPLESAEEEQENSKSKTEENIQQSSNFGNEPNVRTFDGLSVIDEQTEETQTTESPLGYGNSSRGNSANRGFSPSVQMYEEACGVSDYQQFGYDVNSSVTVKNFPKKKTSPYENGAWNAGCDTYEPRPASPYPYNGSLRDSYRKRLEVLQNLPMPSQTTSNTISDGGWILSDSTKAPQIPEYGLYQESGSNFESPFLPGKSSDVETYSAFPPPPNFGFDVLQDRTGPDIFVTEDGFPSAFNEPTSTEVIPEAGEKLGVEEEELDKLEARIDGMKIGEKTERDSKCVNMTHLTKSPVSRDVGESTKTPPDSDCREISDLEKLTIDEAAGENDNEIPKRVQRLVSCQNSGDQDVGEIPPPENNSGIPSTYEMSQTEKLSRSKYQTKLTVTLKTPPAAKPETTKQAGPMTPARALFQHPIRYGIKPEFSTRFQTFPNSAYLPPTPRIPPMDGRSFLVNHYAGIRNHPNGLSGSLPRLPGLVPKPEIGLNASHIPLEDMQKEIDVLPGEESLPIPAAQSLLKPVKIPPIPPPRTSSCPKTIIPPSLLGVNAVHQRIYKKGKPFESSRSMEQKMDPIAYNPLLLSQPIATSSPTISLRATKCGPNSSLENLNFPRFQRHIFHDESSTDDLTKKKWKSREDDILLRMPKLNKSLSSPSFESFRNSRRKPNDVLGSSVENILGRGMPEPICLTDKQKSFKNHEQSNASVSSSSGLDSPIKSDRRKRRVSIQFKKKQCQQEGKNESRGGERRESVGAGILTGKSRSRRSGKGKYEETDATTSERERTNSVSSRTSSLAAGSNGRRKFSNSSNRTYLNDEKIPWCGCWGNGCV